MKIAMLFPGYGSQFVGMGKELYDESRIMQEFFDQASHCLDTNFVKLTFASSDAELGRVINAYTALFLVSAAISALLKEQGIEPDVVAGYNLGEYAAIFAAGGLSLPDGLYLLNKLSSLYDAFLQTQKFSVIRVTGVTKKQVDDMCAKASKGDKRVHPALHITDKEHLVAGHAEAIEVVKDLIMKTEGAGLEAGSIETGLHSPLMDEVIENFRMYLEKVDFKDLNVPLITGVGGKKLERGEKIKDLVISHINSPLVWNKVLDKLSDYDLFIEVGPGDKLSQMVKEKYPDKLIVNINKLSDLEELKKHLPQESIPTEKSDG